MSLFVSYLFSSEFQRFLQTDGVLLILGTMAMAFAGLLMEMQLPLRYYWTLPTYGLRSLLEGLHVCKPAPIWGTCSSADTGAPLPLVAIELLDERTKRPVLQTYSNHLGQYGFRLIPGRYLLRAVKNTYRMPTLLDPENVEIIEIDESFVIPVTVVNQTVAPSIQMPMVPVKKKEELSSSESIWHYGKMFIFQLANVLLLLDILVALTGWAATQEVFYGLILAVAVVLLFIKLYILETISQVAKV